MKNMQKCDLGETFTQYHPHSVHKFDGLREKIPPKGVCDFHFFFRVHDLSAYHVVSGLKGSDDYLYA